MNRTPETGVLPIRRCTEQTNLSKCAPGSYAADDFKDISRYALIKLEKFYATVLCLFLLTDLI